MYLQYIEYKYTSEGFLLCLLSQWPKPAWRSCEDKPDICSWGVLSFKVVSLSSFFSSISFSNIEDATFSSFV